MGTSHRDRQCVLAESPFWQEYLSYLILHVDPDYQTGLVGYLRRGYGWVFARQPMIDDVRYQSLLGRLKNRVMTPANSGAFRRRWHRSVIPASNDSTKRSMCGPSDGWHDSVVSGPGPMVFLVEA
jgi:hypothetical protein